LTVIGGSAFATGREYSKEQGEVKAKIGILMEAGAG